MSNRISSWLYALLLYYNRDREGDRRDRESRDNKGSSRSNRDRELDEDESYERRKRERRQKERSQAYVEVRSFEYMLKHWGGLLKSYFRPSLF